MIEGYKSSTSVSLFIFVAYRERKELGGRATELSFHFVRA